MSSTTSGGLAALPTFAALDVRAVLDEERHGASIQVDERYFQGQKLAIDAVETPSRLTDRRNIVSQSRQFLDKIQIDFDSLTRENLISASNRFRQLLQRLPEVQYLKREFPETCFIVPEWVRTGGEVKYGARIYFFREDVAPAPTNIVQRNIDAVLDDAGADFEEYLGDLHGYPKCCIEYFSTHERRAEIGPELEAVEPIEKYIDDDATAERRDRSASIGDIVDGIFETPHVYAFFAREFYPEPGCEQARYRGVSIYETLSDAYPEDLVKDYFRLNAGWSYLMAKTTEAEQMSAKRPVPGSLGREHLLFYLPLRVTVTTPRYQSG